MAEQRYSQNAPIPYQRTFAAEQLDKQKLTKTVNGEKLEYKVPIFDGNKGVECLMYVHESFKLACARLQINTGGKNLIYS